MHWGPHAPHLGPRAHLVGPRAHLATLRAARPCGPAGPCCCLRTRGPCGWSATAESGAPRWPPAVAQPLGCAPSSGAAAPWSRCPNRNTFRFCALSPAPDSVRPAATGSRMLVTGCAMISRISRCLLCLQPAPGAQPWLHVSSLCCLNFKC